MTSDEKRDPTKFMVEDGPHTEDRMRFPDGIGAVEDLTDRARQLSPGKGGLFDGEATYEEVFDTLTRALHRRAVHVALVGDRGVGQICSSRNWPGGPRLTTTAHFVASTSFCRLPPHCSGAQRNPVNIF